MTARPASRESEPDVVGSVVDELDWAGSSSSWSNGRALGIIFHDAR